MTEIRNAKVLVIGGAGFVGSNLCERLMASYASKVVSLDNYSTGSQKNHICGVKYISGNSYEINELVEDDFDVVFHLGEYSRVEQSFDEIEKVWDYNVRGTFSIINFCAKRNIKLVYAGSSTKYAFVDQSLSAGSDQSPYAWTKSSNTQLIKNYGKWYDLKYAIVYFYNVYGPNEIEDGKYATLIGKFKKLTSEGKPLTIVKPGTQKRNFTHVDDIVDGLILVAEKGVGDRYGIGSPEKFDILEVASMFGGEKKMLPERLGNRLDAELVTIETEKLGWHAKRRLSDYITTFLDSKK